MWCPIQLLSNGCIIRVGNRSSSSSSSTLVDTNQDGTIIPTILRLRLLRNDMKSRDNSMIPSSLRLLRTKALIIIPTIQKQFLRLLLFCDFLCFCCNFCFAITTNTFRWFKTLLGTKLF